MTNIEELFKSRVTLMTFVVGLGVQAYINQPQTHTYQVHQPGSASAFEPVRPQIINAPIPDGYVSLNEADDLSRFTQRHRVDNYIESMKYNFGWWVVKAGNIQASSLDEAININGGAVEAVITIQPGETFNFNDQYGMSHYADGYMPGPRLGGGTINGSGICNVAEGLYSIAEKHPSLSVKAPSRYHSPMPEFTDPDEQGVVIDTSAWQSANLYITNNGDLPVEIRSRFDGTYLMFGTN